MSSDSIQKTSQPSAQSTLPEVIINYITAANDGRIEDAAASFTQDALVHDENRDIQGLAAIHQWIADTTQEFQPKNEIMSVKGGESSYTIISKISGNFPGSPTELQLDFVVANGKISQLLIQ